MDRGRILIMGQTKESTYEIRNLLDNKRYELEIALSRDVGKMILSQRKMNLLILHTEAIDTEVEEFFEFLEERGIEIPIFLLGEEAKRFRETLPARSEVACFEKPYPVEEMLTTIKAL
jgi:DNA-binding NtrC family response regulator